MPVNKIPFQTIHSSLQVYQHMHAPKPEFGMDMYAPDFDPQDIVLLSNNGDGNKGIPIRCDHYIMVFCLSGSGKRRINHHRFTIETSSVHLILPGQIHSFSDTTHDFKIYVLLFEKSILSRFRLAIPELDKLLTFEFTRNPNILLDSDEFQEWLDTFREINREVVQRNTYYKEAATAYIIQLLIRFRRKSSRELSAPEERKTQTLLFMRFKALVEEYFEQKRTVKEYAFMMKVSAKHLSETVKSATTQSALHYIHERIIHEAEYLLVYTIMSIKEVAYALRFDDASHFSRFFKKHKQVTPLDFRTKYA